jgi:ABC-2 type transport system ATP-binding protein
MQQKIQFIATVVHEPKLLILDEPFSGLDPINTNLIKDEIFRLNQEGTSIIFSTHRMEQVEEVCKDIVLINKGKVVITGTVDEIKEAHKDNIFRIGIKTGMPKKMSNAKFDIISQSQSDLVIKITDNMDSNELLKQLIKDGVSIDSYNEIKPSLNEIFIKLVGESDE